jgi:hypothetical protein
LSVQFWPWYCLSFAVSLWPWYCQLISWTKGNWRKTDNIIDKGKLTKDRQ